MAELGVRGSRVKNAAAWLAERAVAAQAQRAAARRSCACSACTSSRRCSLGIARQAGALGGAAGGARGDRAARASTSTSWRRGRAISASAWSASAWPPRSGVLSPTSNVVTCPSRPSATCAERVSIDEPTRPRRPSAECGPSSGMGQMRRRGRAAARRRHARRHAGRDGRAPRRCETTVLRAHGRGGAAARMPADRDAVGAAGQAGPSRSQRLPAMSTNTTTRP